MNDAKPLYQYLVRGRALARRVMPDGTVEVCNTLLPKRVWSVGGHLDPVSPDHHREKLNNINKKRRAEGLPDRILFNKMPPTIKTLERYAYDGVAKATDGCRVEPDGTCPHGHDSWLLWCGYI